MDKANYKKLVKEKSPNSPIIKNVICAFVIGGIICTIGQGVSNLWKTFGLDLQGAASATSITMVFLGGLLTALGLYDKIAKHAGAGTIVPITGFANAIVSSAMEFKSEGLIFGVGSKMFTIAGPVLVYGISASIIYGLVVFFFNIA